MELIRECRLLLESRGSFPIKDEDDPKEFFFWSDELDSELSLLSGDRIGVAFAIAFFSGLLNGLT
jgi:hypothetical protein